jgi:hypothetical protein
MTSRYDRLPSSNAPATFEALVRRLRLERGDVAHDAHAARPDISARRALFV